MVVIEPHDTKPQDTAGKESQADPAERDWKAEGTQYGVLEQMALIRDAPTDTDRQDVVAAALEQLRAKTIRQPAFELIRDYAAHKAS